ncbi:MAG: DUF4143 domain-containing protein [Planctomycetes bacterium]|nr:DUF4143 domain-containing protein [Planctomycetota bacterium]
MRLAALRSGQILNQSELARDAQLPTMTAARYLSLLETSFVIRKRPAYVRNRASRVLKTPKIVFSDSGLAAYMAGVKDLPPEAGEPLRGPLLETYVAQNLSSILAAHWRGAKLHYWCVQGRHEVDFAIEDGRDCLAIEVKSASRWNDGDLVGLTSFVEKHPRCRAAILAHNGREAASLGDRLWAIPLGLLLA